MTLSAASQAVADALSALTDFPVVEGERVRLRGVREDDVDGLFALFSNADVMRFWSRPPMRHRDEAVAYAETLCDGLRRRQALAWIVADLAEDRLLGTTTLYEFAPAHRRAGLGYALQRQHWGRGLASEAAELAVVFGFAGLGLHRIEADVDPRNDASRRLLERAGFHFEGVLRQRFFAGEEIQDSAIYGLLRSEWEALAANAGTQLVSSAG